MREVMYRDDEGLNNLLAQSDDLQLGSITVQTERGHENASALKPKIGMGGVLALLSIPNFNLESEISKKKLSKNLNKIDYIVSSEGKYRSILSILNGNKILYKDHYDAWCAARAASGSVFCEIEKRFMPAGWRQDSNAWLDFANAQSTLVLHYEEDKTLLVGMSISKLFGTHNGRISPTCHLAMRLRRGTLSIRVFGKMDQTKYIKPFFATFS